MGEWKKISQKVLAENPYLKVVQDTVVQPDGKKGDYVYIETADAVNIIPVDHEGNIYLVQQYRYPIRKIVFEVPGGKMTTEDRIREAQKELFEETGIRAETFTFLGVVHPFPARQSNAAYVYKATHLDLSSLGVYHKDDEEMILSVVKVSLLELQDMIRMNKIQDGHALGCLNLFLQNHV